METKEPQATKAPDTVAPQRVSRDICAFAVPKTFLTQEEIILAHTGMLPKKTKSAQEIQLTSS